MANRVAPYKQPYIIEKVEHWWDCASEDEGKTFDSVDAMFLDYVDHQMGTDLDYEAVVSMFDFIRCVYAIGVRRLSDGSDISRQFVRAEHYRPSANMTARFTGRYWQ